MLDNLKELLNGHHSKEEIAAFFQNNHKKIFALHDSHGRSAMYLLLKTEHREIAIELINQFPDKIINHHASKKHKASLLYIAAYHGHENVVSALLAKHADPNLATDKGATPLYVAAQNGQIDTVKMLLEAKADINKPLPDGATPLYAAASNGHTDIVNFLLNNGAKANIDSTGDHSQMDCSPIYRAVEGGYDKIVSALLDHGVDANLMIDGHPLLYIAAHVGHGAVIETLLNHGAEVNKVLGNGLTSLLMAAKMGHANAVNALLSRGADKDVTDQEFGATPLFMAAQNGHIDAVKALLRAGADVNKSLTDGTPPLFMAVQQGHVDVVKELLAAGADISLAHRSDMTLLHHASIDNQSEIVKVLAAHPSTTLEMLQTCENDTHITPQIRDILNEAIQERMSFAESNPEGRIALEFWPKCPISLQCITDPVVAEDGHTYERAFIVQWLQTRNTSPQTRQPLRGNTLIKNFQALDTINTARKVIDSAYKEHKTPKPPAASSSQQVGVLTRASSAPSFFTSERTSQDKEQEEHKSTKGNEHNM